MKLQRTVRWTSFLLLMILLACQVTTGPSGAANDASTAGSSGSAPSGNGKPSSQAAGDGGFLGDGGSSTLSGTVDRGEYLVDHVLMCGVCHTPNLPDSGEPDMSKYLAGSRSYDFTDSDDAGTVVTVNAENLTSHDPEGLYRWSDDQIRTAITKGIDDEHVAIYPIMPYPEYSLLSPPDVDSIIRYLRTVPPNPNVVAADYPYGDQHPPAPPVTESGIPHTTLPPSDPEYAAAERGRYIASTACLNCHTDQISADVPDLSKAFGGGKKYTFIRGAPVQTSTNLTPDTTGLAGWSIDDIATAIKTNTEKGTNRQFCNTHPGGPDRLGKMTDADLRDLAAYIHTLPPVKNGPFKCMQ
jgi:mono/diheme cytochrome c family protein